MGDTADIAAYSSINILFKLYLNPFHSRICKQNTCFNMQYLCGNNVLRAKILTQNVLQKQILTDPIAV